MALNSLRDQTLVDNMVSLSTVVDIATQVVYGVVGEDVSNQIDGKILEPIDISEAIVEKLRGYLAPVTKQGI